MPARKHRAVTPAMLELGIKALAKSGTPGEIVTRVFLTMTAGSFRKGVRGEELSTQITEFIRRAEITKVTSLEAAFPAKSRQHIYNTLGYLHRVGLIARVAFGSYRWTGEIDEGEVG